MPTRYAHTNLVARDWRLLSSFYEQVFGCVPAGPERDLSGAWLDAATGLTGARLRGRHLRLPGHGETGPTLEIFSYDDLVDAPLAVANRIGFGHIAFAVDDVDASLHSLAQHGGQALGQVITTHIPGAGTLTLTYARDPEGNLIELQCWQ